LHVPFCEMRCGFCNLFTTANPDFDLVGAYLDALERQAAAVGAALGPAAWARLAVGGGTPTFLDERGLHRLFDLAAALGADPAAIPVSVETSPDTAEPGRLAALRERGVDRISIGVQSFIESEARAAGRAQRTAAVETALDRIRAAGFPTLNIDLIYGLPGQTVASWLHSLEAALRFAPEELYLYPLYVRPLTGLDRRGTGLEVDLRLQCYRAARDRLLAAGYSQVSMRMFRAAHAPDPGGPVYCCQDDGMVGLGAGARSYTRALHYSSEYAVGATTIKGILSDYVRQPDSGFAQARYGCPVDAGEQRRRYVIQALLQADGLDCAAYRVRFGTHVWADLPALPDVVAYDLARQEGERLILTPAGLERSDLLGPWLYSPRVSQLMEVYELR
ncbi:MAG TPA: STM4012 family radical SAM protein, partial [Herpetosiphonaceae bacterium]|nr:STM4012 family radical SAM protein [Herpetosiphonaceae bacterium]